MKELTEKEANDLSDKATYIKKIYGEGADSLWYKLDDKFIEVWVTRDSSCWVIGGILYESEQDLESIFVKYQIK